MSEDRFGQLCSLLSSTLAAKQQINIGLVSDWSVGYALGQTDFRAPSAESQEKLLEIVRCAYRETAANTSSKSLQRKL